MNYSIRITITLPSYLILLSSIFYLHLLFSYLPVLFIYIDIYKLVFFSFFHLIIMIIIMRGSAITLVCFFFLFFFLVIILKIIKISYGLIARTDLTDYQERSQLRSRDVIEYFEVFGDDDDDRRTDEEE